jgi:DNA-binding response OmpR family regulator
MNPSPRILIVEDEIPMRTALNDCLARQGYRVLVAADGTEGLDKAVREKPELIVLDVMMPGIDGFALCAELRRLEIHTPVLMLTAKGRIEDRVSGLDAGADDYLAKPFSRDELLARIRALLRRTQRRAQCAQRLQLGGVEIDFVKLEASKNGEPLALTAREFAMLRLLAENPGEPVSRDRFLDVVWGYTAFPTTRTVDKHMGGLRAKIENNPDDPQWLKTVHAVGYKLEVTKPSQPEAAKTAE